MGVSVTIAHLQRIRRTRLTRVHPNNIILKEDFLIEREKLKIKKAQL